MKKDPRLDDYLDRLEPHLPKWLAGILRLSRRPSLIWLRIPLAVFLVVGGIAGFLPVLGFWMIPLGVLLLAQDVPILQRPVVGAIQWVERHWPWRKSRKR